MMNTERSSAAQHSARATAVWEAHDVTVADVERQLQRLLRELSAPGERNGAAHPPPRASVLNLVVHADEDGEAERASEAMASLAIRHPSRTLLLETAADAPTDGLDATIRTQCSCDPDGQRHLCFEEIRLLARGATALHLASVVEPLLMSNLPAYLWWLGRPPSCHDPLLGLCDRLVVDSAEFPDALIGLAALDACSVARGKRLDLGDLGWRRIAPWCQLIAQFFDPHDARPYQRRIRRVAVEYASTPSGVVSAAPLLLVGWLAARLDWEPETVNVARGAADALFAPNRQGAEGDGVVAQIRPRTGSCLPAGALAAVTLTAGSGETTATFEVRANDDGACGVTRAVLPGVREIERMAPLGRATTAELLAHELERPGADPIYAETLAMVGRLVR
jgi:glucose-6-phosphate dehydrogenase assembly protein OpcA